MVFVIHPQFFEENTLTYNIYQYFVKGKPFSCQTIFVRTIFPANFAVKEFTSKNWWDAGVSESQSVLLNTSCNF